MPDHAIVIGINRYPYLQSLQGAVSDAHDFHSWVVDPNGGSVPAGNATVIVSTDYQEDYRPMTGDIDQAFRQLVSLPVNSNGYVGDRLYVYTSGHGIAPDADDSALLTADAATDCLGNHVAARAYSNTIRTNGLFEQVILFMDCCRDTADDFPRRPAPFSIRSTGLKSESYFGFATDWDSKARETQINGQTRGLFTTALMAGLRSGAIDGDQLDNYVKSYIRTLANGNNQDPKFFSSAKTNFHFSVSAPPFQVPIELVFSAGRFGTTMQIYDSTFTPIRGMSTVASSTPWNVQLPCGLYGLATPGGPPIQLFQVVGHYQQIIRVA